MSNCSVHQLSKNEQQKRYSEIYQTRFNEKKFKKLYISFFCILPFDYQHTCSFFEFVLLVAEQITSRKPITVRYGADLSLKLFTSLTVIPREQLISYLILVSHKCSHIYILSCSKALIVHISFKSRSSMIDDVCWWGLLHLLPSRFSGNAPMDPNTYVQYNPSPDMCPATMGGRCYFENGRCQHCNRPQNAQQVPQQMPVTQVCISSLVFIDHC